MITITLIPTTISPEKADIRTMLNRTATMVMMVTLITFKVEEGAVEVAGPRKRSVVDGVAVERRM
jgi:hypothetical protein